MCQFMNIYGDFQIYISVPLSFCESFFHNTFFSYVISILKRSSSQFSFDFNFCRNEWVNLKLKNELSTAWLILQEGTIWKSLSSRSKAIAVGNIICSRFYWGNRKISQTPFFVNYIAVNDIISLQHFHIVHIWSLSV